MSKIGDNMAEIVMVKDREDTRWVANTDTFAVMREQAAILVKSGLLPPVIRTPEAAMAVMLTSRELGIGFMEGFRSISVIQGKPTVPPQLMLALARRTKELEDLKFDEKPDGCTVTVRRRGQSPFTVHFGDAEAKAMGLSGKDNYAKQKGVMYRWRALAACLRITFSDAVCGLYTPDEMGAEVNEEGETVKIVDTHIVQSASPISQKVESVKSTAVPVTLAKPGWSTPKLRAAWEAVWTAAQGGGWKKGEAKAFAEACQTAGVWPESGEPTEVHLHATMAAMEKGGLKPIAAPAPAPVTPVETEPFEAGAEG